MGRVLYGQLSYVPKVYTRRRIYWDSVVPGVGRGRVFQSDRNLRVDCGTICRYGVLLDLLDPTQSPPTRRGRESSNGPHPPKDVTVSLRGSLTVSTKCTSSPDVVSPCLCLRLTLVSLSLSHSGLSTSLLVSLSVRDDRGRTIGT